MRNKVLLTVAALVCLAIVGCDGGNGGDSGDTTPPPVPITGGTRDDGCLIDAWQLPKSGFGYYHYAGTDEPGTDNWGTKELIDLIENVGFDWYLLHSEGPRIGILDMSLQYGGPFPPHETHQNGLDVDVRYVRKDDVEAPITINDPQYDRDRSGVLISLFLDYGAEFIFTSDTELAQLDPQIKFVPQHENHFHVRLPQPYPIVPCP